MGLVAMSERDLQRIEVLSKVIAGRMTMVSAAHVLDLSERQVRRLLDRIRTTGAASIRHTAIGRPSNNRISDGVRDYAVTLVRERYADFGPTLAAEKLAERDGLRVSRETLRGWMTQAGLWLSRKQRRTFHQPRLRREAYGELVQIDGSEHRWFEDRGDPCSLLVFVDDATGRLMQLRFVRSESAFSYFDALELYLKQHGAPIAFYSDKHSVFRVTKKEAKGGQGMTQFGRALSELNIEILCATSQAKGRVERMNRTLQDRLVKELRLAGIDTMEAGNAFLPGFMVDYNGRFAIVPARSDDLHRPVNLAPDRLKEILCKREQRYVGSQLTFSFERKRIMLEETDVTRGLAGRYVETYAYADGRLDVRWKGHSLPYKTFDKDQRVTHAAITENKRLGDVLTYIKERQDQQSKPVVMTNSEKNGYVRRAHGPGRRKDFMNDPAVIERRKAALAKLDAAE
ncbi:MULTISPECIES: ISNCY family transposase [Rhizobium]|uniref:ISNCY family insertion sequence transposase protein n=4 Tax=Rhizobium TaxID=379 RepID=A0A1L5PBM2_RHIET|nr:MULTISPECIES: ISNCY family transposase [Rhizobium]EGE57880.1 Integrase catalytic region [Rhizobium etli CNPAF512]APO77569.1 ISNCY family insertion sequence transposase protein [Rhizobium etli 8C-3]MBB4333163.1 transposase [Rhizobium leguminosarum]MBB4358843.1 transposase [Rhizobium leguminosarum]MBB4511242.1 transposase [Rhizobium leguminosarum]